MSNQKKATPAKESSSVNIVIGVLIAAIVLMIGGGIFLAIQLMSDGSGSASSDKGNPAQTQAATSSPNANADMTAIQAEIDSMKATDFAETDKTTEYVKLTVKGHGDIVVRLRKDIAPITVQNFQKLVGEKFYDGLTIHRVSKNFVIQGGDPQGTGSGSSDPIKGEFSANGVQNDLWHVKGVLSMARRSDSYDSDSCQFFICIKEARYSLDGKYAGFGYVVAGLDVVDSIAAVEVNGERPVETIVIEKACFVEKK